MAWGKGKSMTETPIPSHDYILWDTYTMYWLASEGGAQLHKNMGCSDEVFS